MYNMFKVTIQHWEGVEEIFYEYGECLEDALQQVRIKVDGARIIVKSVRRATTADVLDAARYGWEEEEGD
jgi:hypothetical protein